MEVFMKKHNVIKFTTHDRATQYLYELGFSYKSRNNYKEDRSEMWQHKSKRQHAFLKSNYDFFSNDSMEMGTVWTVQQF
tara:strand:+ start:328 stop:564 length:237 start_codon:yes stop_codon:yes gene_type:complete